MTLLLISCAYLSNPGVPEIFSYFIIYCSIDVIIDFIKTNIDENRFAFIVFANGEANLLNSLLFNSLFALVLCFNFSVTFMFYSVFACISLVLAF